MEAKGENINLTQLKMLPCVVPDRGVSDQTMDDAMDKLGELMKRKPKPPKKPWWKFW